MPIVIPSFEDMIADRLGQHAVAAKSDQSRLKQAQRLFKLTNGLDFVYLERCVREEGGDIHLLDCGASVSKKEAGDEDDQHGCLCRRG